MSRTALLGIFSVAAALALDLAPASAQGGGYPLYPWCASYGGGRGGGTNCYFSTWDQCRQAASGNGGYCYRNTWYDAYEGSGRFDLVSCWYGFELLADLRPLPREEPV